MILPNNIVADDTKYLEIIFFLGAGESIPSGLSGVVNLVKDFTEWLEKEGKTDHLQNYTKDIGNNQEFCKNRQE
jgi:hypothetical protein